VKPFVDDKETNMNTTKRKYMARYGLERFLTDNGHGIYTIEGVSRYNRGAEGMFDAEGGVLNGNALFVGEDYGFGKITSIMVEDSGKKDYFKVRVEVEQ
jgi:hypothetical protein